jgi:hypothetical protein
MILRIALVALSLVGQRLLGVPGLPPWAGELLLPMALLVHPALASRPWRAVMPGLWIGLAWDAALEPVVGPGGIAWCAAALTVRAVGGLLADRSTRVWGALGGLGALVVVLGRAAAELPLGELTTFGVDHLLRSVALTAAWCGLVGWVLGLDLPRRWRHHRSRRLR